MKIKGVDIAQLYVNVINSKVKRDPNELKLNFDNITLSTVMKFPLLYDHKYNGGKSNI